MLKSKMFAVLPFIMLLTLALGAPAALAEDNLRLENSNPGHIQAIRVNPLDANTAYLATDRAGVLKTIDNGTTWIAKNAGLPTKSITDLALDPVMPDNLYLATASGAYRSIDGGETWIFMDLGLGKLVFSSLTLIDDLPGFVVLGTESNGIFASDDYGQNWTGMGGQEGGRISALSATSATQDQAQSVGTEVSESKTTSFTIYKADKSGVSALYGDNLADALKSEWVGLWSVNKEIYKIICTLRKGKTQLWIGVHQGGVTYSLDGGKTWKNYEPSKTSNSSAPAAVAGSNINGLSLEPRTSASDSDDVQPEIIYATSYDGFLTRGALEEDSWTSTTLLDASILGVAEVHPRVVATVAEYDDDGALQTPVPLWVGTFGYDPIYGTAYYSADGGATWVDTLAQGWWVTE